MRVPLSGVADIQVVTIEISGVNGGGATADVPFGFLIGDVTGDRGVKNSDLGQLKIDRGQPVTSANFRDDVTLDGVVDKPDSRTVNANKRHRLP